MTSTLAKILWGFGWLAVIGAASVMLAFALAYIGATAF